MPILTLPRALSTKVDRIGASISSPISITATNLYRKTSAPTVGRAWGRIGAEEQRLRVDDYGVGATSAPYRTESDLFRSVRGTLRFEKMR